MHKSSTLKGEMKMKKRKTWLGMLAILLSFGMMVLGACASKPKAYVDISKDIHQIMPGEESVVVYFQSLKTVGGSVWDGEYPIGDFVQKKINLMPIIPYKTTPEEHYFIFDVHKARLSVAMKVVMQADLEQNKRYYVRIETPWVTPPFTHYVVPKPIDEDKAKEILNSKYPTYITFTDEWRSAFATEKLLQEVRERLQEAKEQNMDVDMGKKYGF
jgi:hypothetical protein